jgi:phosphoribosyl 1,2-cyclic phosphate phosphodiesterase
VSDVLEAIILGCGSSGGVPRLGGPDNAGYWGACDPHNPKNRRTRCSLLARRKSSAGETTVLVDTSPDMRQQLLDAHCASLDGVLITHDHADQLHGLDDLRMAAIHMRRRVDVYTDAPTMTGMMARFGYCFVQPEGSSYPPICNAHQIAEPFVPFAISGAGGSLPVATFAQTHGHIRSLGFRFGPLAYSSDVNGLDEAAFAALEGVDCWIVDTLRYTEHPSHAHLAQSLAWIARVKPRRAILTNLHVDLDYETLKRELPPGVEPAHDGMRIELPI